MLFYNRPCLVSLTFPRTNSARQRDMIASNKSSEKGDEHLLNYLKYIRQKGVGLTPFLHKTLALPRIFKPLPLRCSAEVCRSARRQVNGDPLSAVSSTSQGKHPQRITIDKHAR